MSDVSDNEASALLELPRTPPTTLGVQTAENIEETLGQCRTLAFLANNIPTLKAALSECKRVMESIALAVTTSLGSNAPPTFLIIAHTGLPEFRTSKALHRIGTKQKV